MDLNNIYIGKTPANFSNKEVSADQVTFEGEAFFKISNFNKMRPFFMSIVSNSDHWMFISSTGGLSAGRKNSDYSLFPYYTDDKITESSEHTGSKSIFIVTSGQRKITCGNPSLKPKMEPTRFQEIFTKTPMGIR